MPTLPAPRPKLSDDFLTLPSSPAANDKATSACNQDSLNHSMRDGIAFSVMSGAGETYLSAYALFLKATAEEIALLASVPPLIGSGMQLVSAWLGRRGMPRKPLIVAGRLRARLNLVSASAATAAVV